MQFPKHITTIQSTNVEIPPFFNELINIRETKLHARFTKSVSLATNVRSRREGGAAGEREAQPARGRHSRREGGTAGEREAQPARGRRSRREGGAVDGAAANERVNTGPNGAARNYVRIHTHEAQNVCMVGLTVR